MVLTYAESSRISVVIAAISCTPELPPQVNNPTKAGFQNLCVNPYEVKILFAQSNQIDPAIPAQTDPHFCWRKIA